MANYSVNLPEKSYINVEEFSTPARFAEYVKAVAADNALYEEHHAWRKTYKIDVRDESVAVDPYWMLCKYALLHHKKEKPPINIEHLRGASQCTDTQGDY